jgi:hypothetical protein
MRTVFNDVFRRWVGWSIRVWGFFLTLAFERRLANLEEDQRRLKERLAVDNADPVMIWGPVAQKQIDVAAHGAPPTHYAATSGSTATPKRIYFPPKRVRAVKRTYMEAFGRLFHGLSIARTSLYVFSTLSEDDSLTARMMTEKCNASWISLLQAPYRIHHHAVMRRLREEYGTTAVRLFVLLLSNPGVFYATNPSTLSTFVDALEGDWEKATHLVKKWVSREMNPDRGLKGAVRKLLSRGAQQRLEAVAQASRPLPLADLFPGLTHVVCWDGGYVAPFLNRLKRALGDAPVQLVPMYSMSTEVVETLPRIKNGTLSFVPAARGVLYEFLPEGAARTAENLLTPRALSPGDHFLLVVSDAYGLRRYLTDDVFKCQSQDGGVPDLRFLRRASLSYSFTGEKLTGAQLDSVFATLREEIPELASDDFLTCIPSQPPDEKIPHYKLILVKKSPGAFLKAPALCKAAQLSLRATNSEYAAKVKSDRLAPLRLVQLSQEELLDRLAPGGRAGGWEAQFKFLPLYRKLWEELS